MQSLNCFAPRRVGLLGVAALALASGLLAAPRAEGRQEAAKPAAAAASAARDEKAEEVIRRAVEVMGGRAYLDVRSVVSRGYFTPYAEGTATIPISFTDYLVFPDRERTEFKGKALRSVEAYAGERGWIYDGAKLTLKDADAQQMQNFRTALRTSLDNVLRGWWRAEGAALKYVGRREAGLGRRNEVVRVSYPEGFSVEFEFGARDGLPAKVIYRRQNAEGEEVEEEDRYAQFLNIGGVTVPFVVDHFRAGTQSSRVNYQAVEFNRPVPDALFARPADGKTFKF